MTWSIVAFDTSSGAFAVAVTTRSLAVGANCPFVRAGVGAVSTQSMTNRYLAPLVLDALEAGAAPADAVARAIATDGGRGVRQLHAVDRHGNSAAWTGDNCVEWCGSRSAPGVSVAGNMLAGAPTVEATLETWLARADLELPERLLAALDAGEAAGGDRRGRQSAAMKIVTTEDFPDLDLRVDDHAEPLVELRRLTGLWRAHFPDRKSWMPTRANPDGITDLDAIEATWRKAGLDIRFRR
ncbi:MAG TPA: DUF1028 domain-containing protein [Hyphomicrobiaceae bacterium]|nr:DUF1028 domain-containing protein [Hyphomicrobiaceae bacterium]